jgi:hypothetical protein
MPTTHHRTDPARCPLVTNRGRHDLRAAIARRRGTSAAAWSTRAPAAKGVEFAARAVRGVDAPRRWLSRRQLELGDDRRVVGLGVLRVCHKGNALVMQYLVVDLRVPGRRQHGRIHDVLLFYTKGDEWTWNPVYTALRPGVRGRVLPARRAWHPGVAAGWRPHRPGQRREEQPTLGGDGRHSLLALLARADAAAHRRGPGRADATGRGATVQALPRRDARRAASGRLDRYPANLRVRVRAHRLPDSEGRGAARAHPAVEQRRRPARARSLLRLRRYDRRRAAARPRVDRHRYQPAGRQRHEASRRQPRRQRPAWTACLARSPSSESSARWSSRTG